MLKSFLLTHIPVILLTLVSLVTLQGCNGVDPEPDIQVSPTGGLITSESGTEQQFNIVLITKPKAKVMLDLRSSNENEGTIGIRNGAGSIEPVSNVVFTPSNWNEGQTIIITGVDDNLQDGNVAYSIITDTSLSTDPDYTGINPSDVQVVNEDNDGLQNNPGTQADVVVSTNGGLTTSEDLTTATFNVKLNSAPTADVVIVAISDKETEALVTSSELTFTTNNWATEQTITIVGVDDNVDDDDQTYVINLAATSSDQAYNNLAIPPLTGTNQDNDTAGVTVLPARDLITSENLTSDTFTVVLNSQPTASVTVTVDNSTPIGIQEGTVDINSFTFDNTNWNQAKTFTVTGLNDNTVDGDKRYNIRLPLTTTDLKYSILTVATVSVVNQDNDTVQSVPGVTVTPLSGIITSEGGATGTIKVKLDSAPTADVMISATSNNNAEAMVTSANLTFTTTNWQIAQDITVTGVDDNVDDDNQTFAINFTATSSDQAYNNFAIALVAGTNQDNDTAGVTVLPARELVTSENLTSDTFTVVLNSQPTVSVTITVDNSTPIGIQEGTVDINSFTFDSTNWNQAQTFTVTGLDDAIIDGDQRYNIRLPLTTTDLKYSILTVATVSVVNQDNDAVQSVPGVTVTPLSGIITSEAGTTGTIKVKLNSAPTADVMISATSNNNAEATVTSANLTFTTTNWQIAQDIIVTGVDDNVDDDDQAYSINFTTTSGDQAYNNFTIPPVTATNQDNDTAGVTVLPARELVTSENLTSDTFTMVLNSQPTTSVIVTVDNNTPIGMQEGVVDINSFTFDNTNWNQVKTFTVTGLDDAIIDGDQRYVISLPLTTTDLKYSVLAASTVNVVNRDNDTVQIIPGITVTPLSGIITSEAGATDILKVKLDSAPTADVTLSAASSNSAEATVTSADLTFTSTNWQIEQNVVIVGIDDNIDDDDQTYTINLTATSSDPVYNNFTMPPVTATNQDNDTAGVTVLPARELVTSENLTSDTFTVVLNSQPTASVTVTVDNSSQIGIQEGTVDFNGFTFDNTNWNQAQTFTVTGLDDAIVDGDQRYSINLPLTTTDLKYSLLAVSTVNVVNQDNDTAPATPGVTITPSSGLETSENQTTTTFTVVLNTPPLGEVDIFASSSNTAEGVVAPDFLIFLPQDWDIPQTFSITGVDDPLAALPRDGDIAYTINLNSMSSDINYDSTQLTIAPVNAINRDNDTPGVTITPLTGLITSEVGTTTTITVVLNSPPTGEVDIFATSGNIAEGLVSPNFLIFLPNNWNIPQTFTVTGQNDLIVDPDVIYSIQLDPQSSDIEYNNTTLILPSVEVTNINIQ